MFLSYLITSGDVNMVKNMIDIIATIANELDLDRDEPIRSRHKRYDLIYEATDEVNGLRWISALVMRS